jgi:hypothetical protein
MVQGSGFRVQGWTVSIGLYARHAIMPKKKRGRDIQRCNVIFFKGVLFL